MKFILLTAALIVSLGFSATAQFSLGAGVAPAIPLGEFSRFTNFGFGLNLDGRYFLHDQLAIGLGIGYYNFSTDFSETGYRITPVTLSAEYFFNKVDGPTPYVGLDIGSYTFSFVISTFRVSQAYFGLAPTFGILYPLSDQLMFDGNVQYGLIFSDGGSTTYLPINLGVRLRIGE